MIILFGYLNLCDKASIFFNYFDTQVQSFIYFHKYDVKSNVTQSYRYFRKLNHYEIFKAQCKPIIKNEPTF